MSRKTALETIDARLRLFSDAESGSLRRWKIAIEKAYAELRENLPGFELVNRVRFPGSGYGWLFGGFKSSEFGGG